MSQQAPTKTTLVDEGDESSDDNISLNSTEGSEHSENHEFEVERILAEKTEGSKKLYLLRWNGYPLHRATWEPRNHIFDNSILATWGETQIREFCGLDQPFDVEKFEAEVEKLAEEKAQRHRRRELKRAWGELLVSGSDSESSYSISSGSDSVEANLEIEDMRSDDPGLRNTGKSPSDAGEKPVMPVVIDQESVAPNLNHKRSLSASSLEEPLSSTRRKKSQQNAIGSDFDQPLASRAPKAATVPNKTSISNKNNSHTTPKPCPSTPTLDGPTTAVGRGKGATRGTSVAPPNVFAIRNAAPKRPTLLQTSANSSKDKKHFKNMSILRKAELASRALEDAAPDPDAVGGLFVPGDPSNIRDLQPANLRKNSATSKTPQDQISAESPRPLPLDGRSSTKETELGLSTPATAQKPYPDRATCYYWDVKGTCSRGYQCKYMHSHEAGIPVAPRPADKRDSTRARTALNGSDLSYSASPSVLMSENVPYLSPGQESQYDPPLPNNSFLLIAPQGPRVTLKKHNEICWFWHTKGVCSKGELCMFHHTESESMPLAPDPYRSAPTPKHISSEESTQRQTNSRDAGLAAAGPKIEVCKFWQSGDCYHGAKCRFIHELPSGAGAAPAYEVALRESSPNVVSVTQVESQRRNTNEKPIGSPPAVSLSTQQNFGLDDTQSALEECASTIPEPAATMSTKCNKTSIEDRPQNRTVKVLGTRVKTVTFGVNGQQSLHLDTGDTGREALHPLHELFSSLSHIRFDQICTAQDFASQQSVLQRCIIWHGSLSPVNTKDPEDSRIIDTAVKELRLRVSGLICATAHLVILAYPARAEEWKFIDCSSYSKEVRLRYMVLQTTLNIKSCLKTPVKEIVSFRPPYRMALTDKIYGLSVENLWPLVEKAHNPQNLYNFYLLFPPAANESARFITQWLRSININCNIYSSETEGSWDFVVKAPTLMACVVLVHDSVAIEIYRLPLLQELLRKSKKIFTFWYISDSSARFPMFPSVFDLDCSNIGQLVATRLFPHGAIIFLTPSFLVAEPERTYELLKWFFNKKLDSVTPGTWKLACCYNFAEYLLSLANAKAFERQRFYEENHDKPSKDAEANQRGLGFESCQLRYKIHTFLTGALHSRNNSRRASIDCCNYYSGVSDELESPIIYSDRYIDADNEQSLIQWFAGWAMGRLDIFRKFTVIGTGPGSVKKITRLKELSPMTVNRDPQMNPPTLQPKQAPSSPIVPVTGPNLSAVNPAKQKALMVAAKLQAFQLSKTNSMTMPIATESTIKTYTGHKTSHHCQQPSIANRGAVEVDTQVSDLIKDRNPGAQALKSTAAILSTRLEQTYVPHSARAAAGSTSQVHSAEVERGQVQWKQIPFEPTTTWYKSLKANGEDWEHVTVESWDQCWSYLGIGQK